MTTDIQFTFFDRESNSIYLRRQNTIVNGFTIQDSIAGNIDKHKQDILEYINWLDFIPYLEFKEVEESIRRVISFDHFKLDSVVYFIYLDEIDERVKDSLDDIVYNYKDTYIRGCHYYLTKHVLGASLRYNPHYDLQPWIYRPVF